MKSPYRAVGGVKALTAALITELGKESSNLHEIFSCSDEQWEVLTSEQYDRVIRELANKSYYLDAPIGYYCSRIMVDPWGNRLEIKYRRVNGKGYRFQVSSLGADGLSSTEDDFKENSWYESPTR